MIDELLGSYYIAKKDLKEYYFKPGTISWGLVFPIAFTLAFFIRHGGSSTWLAPGMISLAIFFGATSMSGMSLVFERRIGSFERLLLFPISYTGIALGKTLSSFLYGVISAVPVIILAFILVPIPPSNPLLLIMSIAVATFLSSTFGVLLSFSVNDPSQIMIVFNLVRFPMMFLSDTIIPVASLPELFRVIALAMPLTYMTESIRYSYTTAYDLVPPLPSIALQILLSIIFLFITSRLIKSKIP